MKGGRFNEVGSVTSRGSNNWEVLIFLHFFILIKTENRTKIYFSYN